MTSTKRGNRIAKEFLGAASNERSALAALIKREIDEAVAAEREACAVLAKSYFQSPPYGDAWRGAAHVISGAIRARCRKTPRRAPWNQDGSSKISLGYLIRT